LKNKYSFLFFVLVIFLVGCSDYDQDGITQSEKAKKKYDNAINQVINDENEYLNKKSKHIDIKRNRDKTGVIVYEDVNLIEVHYSQFEKRKYALYEKEDGKYVRRSYTEKLKNRIDSSEEKYIENVGIK